MHLHILLASYLASLVASQTCPRVYVRKEVRDMTDGEWNAFANALRRFHSGTSPTAYDRFVRIHIDNRDPVHGWPLFFPWHREYLLRLERELQRLDPSVSIPYWDWGYDSQAPEMSRILSATRYGGSGTGSGRCVTNGAFAGWQMAFPSRHCLQRTYGSRIPALHSTESLNRIITQSNSYDTFRRALEGAPHGSVHNNIGGDMVTMNSPNDPLFWAHHAFIDKLWADWQRVKPTLANTFNGRNRDGTSGTPDTSLPAFTGRRVRDVFSTSTLCYTYQNLQIRPMAVLRRRSLLRLDRSIEERFVSKITPNVVISAEDRTDVTFLRIPRPLPASFCTMNNLNVTEVRLQEANFTDTIKKINSLEGYVSPSALWLRTDLLEAILARGITKTLRANAKGKLIEVKLNQVELNANVGNTVEKFKEAVREMAGGHVRGPKEGYQAALTALVGIIPS